MSSPLPLVTAEQLARETAGRSLVHQALDYWVARSPNAVAIINATRGTSLTWRQLHDASIVVEQNLRRMGFRKGDFLAASLPFLSEHIILEYACFRAGVIHAPLDLRLGPAEVMREVEAIGARGYAHLGKTPLADFRDLAKAVKAHCPSVEHLLQFSPAEECIEGAIPVAQLFEPPASFLPPIEISPEEGVQVVFTSGSPGSRAWSFHACLRSQTAQSHPDPRGDAPIGFAFRYVVQRRRSDRDHFAAQYPAYTCPCQRFNGSLTAGHA